MLWAFGSSPRSSATPWRTPVSQTERFSRPARRRAAALATTLALAGGTLALGMTAAVAGVTPPASGQAQQPRVVWAMTVTGRRVPVTKPAGPSTPVHPEKITHPGLDFMGSTVA